MAKWIRLSRLYAHRKDLFTSSKVRDCLFHGLLRDYGQTHERDQRLLREALILLGEDVVDHLAEYSPMLLCSTSTLYFNSVEIFGYLQDEISDTALCLMQSRLDDQFVAPSVLQAVGRNLRDRRMAFAEDRRYEQVLHSRWAR